MKRNRFIRQFLHYAPDPPGNICEGCVIGGRNRPIRYGPGIGGQCLELVQQRFVLPIHGAQDDRNHARLSSLVSLLGALHLDTVAIV